jgi:hypothetical protein
MAERTVESSDGWWRSIALKVQRHRYFKDVGKAVAFSAKPPFGILKVLDTGPITNHVNFVRNAHGQFAYVTVGGLNEVQVFRTTDFAKIATVPVGKLPHGIWPSGDGARLLCRAGK